MQKNSAGTVGSAQGVSPFTPQTLISLDGVPLAKLKAWTPTSSSSHGSESDPRASVLPFDLASCTLTTLSTAEEADAVQVVASKEWRMRAKISVSLDLAGPQHWVWVTSSKLTHDVQLAITDTTAAGISAFESGPLTGALTQAFPVASNTYADIHVRLMSRPSLDKVGRVVRNVAASSTGEAEAVNERVCLADNILQLAHLITGPLRSFFVDGVTNPTSVFWPPCLSFPVNVHAGHDALRVAEHEVLLLPRRRLLRLEQRAQKWSTFDDLPRPPAADSASPACGDRANFRSGAAWERHLVTNPHVELKKGPTPLLDGAATLLTTGAYDYYHYRVDGFKDDGWGCAYRSLQTILSWFQHEGIMTAPMPSLREIQQILSVVDPDKAGNKNFVGSSTWIGSFEIMMVLQHFVPGLECTIKRLESAAELDSDPGIQGLLWNHFNQANASPVMIGGSSYAHTILGVHMNVETTEAQYLILDPHYSANPTNLKAAINKGYVGWKEASKFFEASQWYNVCIPRVDLFDPR